MNSSSNRHSTAIALCLALAGVLVASADAARQEPAISLEVTTTARALRPGEVVLLAIHPTRPVVSISGTAFSETLHPWSSDGNAWWALVGIPLSTRPASYTVGLQSKSADGRMGTARVPLAIGPGQFSSRRLTVDPQFVNPPASAMERIAAEAKAMADLFAHPTPDRLWHGAFRVPVPGQSTSSFGRLSILNGESRSRHQGADFRAAEGTDVHAPNGGRVVLVADYYFSGNTVIIDHGAGLFSLFAHFSKVRVEQGSMVKTGDVLGEAGATGRVTGPHVHWAVRLNGASVDPLSLVEALATIVE
jgi:murein DD-endopeptidase MepM/ murein hydrolase activator NlpD